VKVADREDSFPSLNSKFSLCAFIFIAIWFTSAEIIGVVIRIQQARPSAARMAIQPLKLTWSLQSFVLIHRGFRASTISAALIVSFKVTNSFSLLRVGLSALDPSSPSPLCATLHHVPLGPIDDTQQQTLTPQEKQWNFFKVVHRPQGSHAPLAVAFSLAESLLPRPM
jgi:hypothetical protein